MAIEISIDGGDRPRRNCPVTAAVPLGYMGAERLVLRRRPDGDPVPCQVRALGNGAYEVAWIEPRLEPGRPAGLLFEQGDGPKAGAGVALDRRDDGSVAIGIDGVLFSEFHYASRWARPFLHPLIGPHGQPVTRAYPIRTDVAGEKQDHPHHKSFWVAWGDVNGSDNWSENRAGHGTQRVRQFTALESGPVYGRIACELDWLSEKGAKVLEESRQITVWRLPAALRAVDLEVTFRATEGPVRFGDTKEGGICSIRVASSMDASGPGTIVNGAGGVDEGQTWGKRAEWCDYVGPVGAHTVGIAILDHPANFRHPTYWHVRNYGLMTANPFGLSHFLRDKTADGSHTLEAGASLTFRYRVLIHDGDTATADIAGKYRDFSDPPKVTLR
ncbi:MAG: PmoA family protein [Lentisphaeria bacterium]|nr:PmoA family protein [Lentisphaeria bacterium]